MSFWSWDPSLSIGVDVIDEQHKRIVDYINELDVARRESDRERISEILEGLVDYTLTHFSFEEELMNKSGYPLTDSHRDVHASFAIQIGSYVDQHNAGKDISRKLMSDLQIWLTNHIRYQDQDYGQFLQQSPTRGGGWVSRMAERLLGK